jgi:TPR repeat protein
MFYLHPRHDLKPFQAVLSNCYLHGAGVAAADASTALLLAQESTSLNNANGAVRLGYMLQYGKACPKDLPAAAKFYKMASDRGHAEGLYRLAAVTQTGDGVAADECRFHCSWAHSRIAPFPPPLRARAALSHEPLLTRVQGGAALHHGCREGVRRGAVRAR